MLRRNVVHTNTSEGDPSSARTSEQFPTFRRAHALATAPRWQMAALAKLTELVNLPAGWDSYDAAPITNDAAMFSAVVASSPPSESRVR